MANSKFSCRYAWNPILVPIDFSTPSLAALRQAVRYTQTVGGELLLLHVVEGQEGTLCGGDHSHAQLPRGRAAGRDPGCQCGGGQRRRTIATVVHLISSGQVRLSAEAVTAMTEVPATADAAA